MAEQNDYTALALRTEAPVDMHTIQRLIDCAREVHGTLGAASECGELGSQLKAHIFYGKPLDRTNLKEEIGDAAWFLALLADTCDVTLDQCMRANLAKLLKRYPEMFTQAAAITRDLDAERAALELVGSSEPCEVD